MSDPELLIEGEVKEVKEVEEVLDENQIKSEILDKRRSFDSRMSSFMQEFNDQSRMYRMIPPSRKSTVGLSNTIVSETTRAVETIATFWYAIIFSANPFFDVRPMRGDIDEHNLTAISSLLSFQRGMDQILSQEAFLRLASLRIHLI